MQAQAVDEKAIKRNKKHKAIGLDKKKSRVGWIFVLPFVIALVVIYIPVLFDSIRYSFSTLTILSTGGYTLEWAGLQNYSDALFTDTDFVKTLISTVEGLLLDVPAIVVFSLFMAVLLNQKQIGRTAFRAIFFIPVILQTGIITKLDASDSLSAYMATTTDASSGGAGGGEDGLINTLDIQYLLGNMKVGTELVEYVVDLVNNVYSIINRSGVQMLVFLAGLQSISPAIYESCQIDGATAWETFWKITFPMISPMILVNAIYTVIDSFTRTDNAVMVYIDQVYAKTGGRTLSSAMSWLYFLIVILLLAAVAGIVSAFVFYQRRD